MSSIIAQHIDTPDHRLWDRNLGKTHDRLLTALANSNVAVLPCNVVFSMWDSKIHDCNVALINYDDIVWDLSWFEDLEKTAKNYNVKFTLITNIAYTKETHCEWYKVLFLKELFGVFYNPFITQKNITQPHNLFTCLMQRTVYSRLKLFAEISRNDLLKNGNVSLLGYQLQQMTVDESINQANMHNEFDDILEKHQFPFKNFEEINNCFEIEQQSKYTIVPETYNNDISPEWISFTEKTFRSLQIPNISVLLNKKGSIEILNSLGIKTHPINQILDYMMTFDAQTEFIIGLLSSDIFDSTEVNDIAAHNQQLIKRWYDTLQTEDFYDNVIDQVLSND